MKAVNYGYENHDYESPKARSTGNVIYLYDNRRVRARRRVKNHDLFWNVVFTGLCLSVLVVLFLH